MNNQQKAEYKVWWDKEEKIGRIFVKGEVDEKMTIGMMEEGKKLEEEYGPKINWLVDLSKVTKPILLSRVRKMMAEGIKVTGIGKIAVVGASIIVRTVINFIAAVFGKKNLKFFLEEKEAIKWLKKK